MNIKKNSFLPFLQSNHLKNSIWNIAEVVLYPLGLLVATPLFINRLGVDQYGIWMLANSIIASIGVLNVGLGDATIKYISKYKALNKPDAIHKVVQSNYTIYLGLSILLGLVGIGLAFCIHQFNWFNIPIDTHDLMIALVPIGSITLGFRFLEQVFVATFKGFERYDISAKLLLASKGSILISNVVLVIFGFSLIHIFVFTAILSLTVLIVEIFFVKRYIPAFSFVPKLDRVITKEVVGFGLWSWIQSVFSIATAQLDKFIVASFAGVRILAFYSIGYMIYTQLHNVFAACANWLFPFVSAKIEKNEKVEPIYHKARFALLIAGLSIILALFLIKDVLFLGWLGEEVYQQSKPFIIGFMAYEALMVMSIIPYYFLSGSGLPKLNAFLELILKSLNIIGMLLFFYLFGVEGIVLGLISSVVLFIPFQDYIIQSRVFSQRFNLKSIGVLLPSLIFLVVLLGEPNNLKYLFLLLIPLVMKWAFFNQYKSN